MTTVTEFEALASICAAVGDAIDGDPALRDPISKVLGIGGRAAANVEYPMPDPRNSPGARSPGAGTDDLPSVDEALGLLAAVPARGDAAATRVLAIAGLVHADPAYGPGGAKRSLVLPALSGGDPALAELAPDLLEQVGRAQTNDDLRAVMVDTNLTRVVIGGIDVDPVPTFQTDFVRRGRTVEDVKLVLNPENWPRCCRWWSRMVLQDSAGGRPHYRETVADSIGFLKVDVCLQFVQAESPDEVVLDYRKCDVAAHQPQNPRVVVDEGWIVGRRHDAGVRILTSKRVLFADTIGGRSLVPTAVGLGYGMLAEELVDGCLGCETAEPKWAPVEVSDGR
jgi:hypothetical protein